MHHKQNMLRVICYFYVDSRLLVLHYYILVYGIRKAVAL